MADHLPGKAKTEFIPQYCQTGKKNSKYTLKIFLTLIFNFKSVFFNQNSFFWMYIIKYSSFFRFALFHFLQVRSTKIQLTFQLKKTSLIMKLTIYNYLLGSRTYSMKVMTRFLCDFFQRLCFLLFCYLDKWWNSEKDWNK
jgi:hypothetical protein